MCAACDHSLRCVAVSIDAASDDPNRDSPTSNESEVEVLPAITVVAKESDASNEIPEEKKKEDAASKPSPLKSLSDAKAADEEKASTPESGKNTETKPKVDECKCTFCHREHCM